MVRHSTIIQTSNCCAALHQVTEMARPLLAGAAVDIAPQEPEKSSEYFRPPFWQWVPRMLKLRYFVHDRTP
jgi:hypothetical protein